ncbi:YggN family protein [Lysobacter xanthus]
MKATTLALLFASALPLASHAGPRSEMGLEMHRARAEIRSELAQERMRLETENLSLDNDIQFGKHKRNARRDTEHGPKAEITPAGDLLVDGKAVPVDAVQRRQLLDYRTQVIGIAKTGMAAGEKAAMLALDATDVSMFQLIVGGLTGSLERRVESTVQRELRPAMLQICASLPRLQQSQQALAATVTAFRPYATLRDDDIATCEADVRRDLASR